MKDPVVSIDRVRSACKGCNLSTLCLPVGLATEDVGRLAEIVQSNHIYHRGDHLYRAGDSFTRLFVVKSGSVKSYYEHAESGEQVLGFHLPGEIVGLEGVADSCHASSAMVLETTSCCELPFDQLEKLAAHVPSLQHQMYRLFSKEIGEENQMLTLLGRYNAEQRLAAFLLSISARLKQRGLSATEFQLSMSRGEIGNYLGLAVETISRLFRKFHEQGLVEADRKRIKLLRVGILERMVDPAQSNCEHYHLP